MERFSRTPDPGAAEHPALRTYDGGDEDTPVHGDGIRRRPADHRIRQINRALEQLALFIQVCDAVAYAHRNPSCTAISRTFS